MQGISEAFLHPVLESVIAQFPFELAGFHSDSGAEYINASVVRKHMGFAHIPQKHAARINAFYQQTFNPWLNLHRPCMYATEVISPKGKIVMRYQHEDVKTPLECLVMLCQNGLVTLKKASRWHRCRCKPTQTQTWLRRRKCNAPSMTCLQALSNKNASPEAARYAPCGRQNAFGCRPHSACPATLEKRYTRHF